nr:hypothetical protein [Desulfobacula sp.]
MFEKILMTCILFMILISCSVSNDPRNGGLFGGIRGIYGGGYDSRIQQRQEKLAEEQEVNRNLQEKSKNLENEMEMRDSVLNFEQQRTVNLKKDLSLLESNINKLISKSDQQKKEVAALRLKIEKLKKRLSDQRSAIIEMDQQGGSEANRERYRILQQERDRLYEEYRRLFEYFQALSSANS